MHKHRTITQGITLESYLNTEKQALAVVLSIFYWAYVCFLGEFVALMKVEHKDQKNILIGVLSSLR